MEIISESGHSDKKFPEWGVFDVTLMHFDGRPVFHIDIPFELYPIDADEEECAANFSFTLRDALEEYLVDWGGDDKEEVAITVALLREYANKLEARIGNHD